MDETVKTENQNPKPWLWKKGQSGNPKGRPKGKNLKEWVRGKLAEMTEEERIDFLARIDPYKQWTMAEGNPDTKEKHEHSGEIKTGYPLPEEAIKIIEEDLKKKKLN